MPAGAGRRRFGFSHRLLRQASAPPDILLPQLQPETPPLENLADRKLVVHCGHLAYTGFLFANRGVVRYYSRNSRATGGRGTLSGCFYEMCRLLVVGV